MPGSKMVSVDADLRISTGNSSVRIRGRDSRLSVDLSPASAWRLRKHLATLKSITGLLRKYVPAESVNLQVRVLGVAVKKVVL